MQGYQGCNLIFTGRGVFISDNDKTLTSCGIGNHYKNSGEEEQTQEVIQKYGVMVLHAAIRWPGILVPEIQPMVLERDVHLQNTTLVYDS